MSKTIIIRANEYYDSMVLMQVNHAVSALPGVIKAGILMASEMNKKLMSAIGFADAAIADAQPGDMMIGIEAEDDAALENAITTMDARLSERKQAKRSRSKHFGSLAAARRARPEANLAVISVPGDYAAREARKALDAGLNCFLFSDNVSREDELALKQHARELDLLLMGPDCGTAVIDGAALGFANAVSRGEVGVIAASGTGMQEFVVLLDRLGGQGITQGIGLGGRDLSTEIGGLSAVKSFRLLADDPETKCIAFISKPPDPRVVEVVSEAAIATGKPVLFCLLEPSHNGHGQAGGIPVVYSIEEAAVRMLALLDKQPDKKLLWSQDEIDRLGGLLATQLRPEQKCIRGLFAGGSMCLEVMAYLVPRMGSCYSNIAMPGALPIGDFAGSGHCFWDMGEDEFTHGRVHPMIDPGLVAEGVIREAARPDVGVIVLDMVLGYGTNPDPSEIYAPTVEKARSIASSQGRTLHVLVHVCGTEGDPQTLSKQEQRMREAGATICATNLQLAKLALATVGGLEK